ncbi:hypothetical protein NDU88_001286 [Pleurodeles waltl]|uniref:Uncharacterized protein n=1 Tax=Pleurodeles waltl TaxID=8319 RepID=A0AAV7VZF2_PLEWA|nr:hypothetical protein NDU88_001286 [Pleurodeles waltl]
MRGGWAVANAGVGELLQCPDDEGEKSEAEGANFNIANMGKAEGRQVKLQFEQRKALRHLPENTPDSEDRAFDSPQKELDMKTLVVAIKDVPAQGSDFSEGECHEEGHMHAEKPNDSGSQESPTHAANMSPAVTHFTDAVNEGVEEITPNVIQETVVMPRRLRGRF